MDINPEILHWLLEGDPAIRWQVQRDLLDEPSQVYEAERQRVTQEGWGAQLLSLQDPDGKWGGGLYGPKWISTTYTLLALRMLGLPADNAQAHAGCKLLLEHGLFPDGGINFSHHAKHSETCITGMVLSILSYFRYPDPRLETIVLHLLGQQMGDGGWNCESYKGATHSSFNTTLLVIEGLNLYEQIIPAEAAPLQAAQTGGREFLLQHQLYRSHRTGEVVSPAMTRFPFPPRWQYDVLRALDYFQRVKAERDERLEDPIALLLGKRKADGRWPAYRGPSGLVFFDLEQAGEPGRANTLRALRVLRWWDQLPGS
jgi:hypothetical protein